MLIDLGCQIVVWESGLASVHKYLEGRERSGPPVGPSPVQISSPVALWANRYGFNTDTGPTDMTDNYCTAPVQTA